MAEKMDDANSGEGNSPTTKHNVAKVSDAIIKAATELFEAEQKEKKAIADHVQCYRDDKKRIKSNLKKDTEIEITDFNLHYKPWRRQQLAKLEMEEEDRMRVLDNNAIVFDAFGQASMLDYLDKFNEPKPEKKPKKKPVDAKSPEDKPAEDKI